MGRQDKQYSLSLYRQIYDRLTGMQAFGTSKKDAIADGTAADKIFSFSTYKTYWKHSKYFLDYLKETHPDCTTLHKARGYVNEWLQHRCDQGLSAWTIQTEAKAMSKIFGIKPEDKDYFTPPKRNRADIKRSRTDSVRDRHFSVTNNDELIKFCKGTGLRRSELEKLKGNQLWTLDQIKSELDGLLAAPTNSEMIGIMKDAMIFEKDTDAFLLVTGKGGRHRFVPVVGPHRNQIVERIQNTAPGAKVWGHVHSNADIHGYRADYATAMYKNHARDIGDIPYDATNKGTGQMYQKGVYTCRKDEKGKKLDREALGICSKALGHNRVEIVATNYSRAL